MEKVAVSLVPSPGHTSDGHPENAGRFTYFDRLREGTLARNLEWLDSVPAPAETVAAVHPATWTRELALACARLHPGELVDIDPAPTYISHDSWQAALAAVGGTLAVSRAVVEGRVRHSFALVRPPGHHAGRKEAQGFCLLNNLAITVTDALKPEGSQRLDRVAIVDFDAHHGNGTEEIFWDSPQVGFFSLHQEGIYPWSGLIDEAPHARGRILNLPLPERAGDAALDQSFKQIIEPWLRRFHPEMIFVSAGFDGHWSDPLTNLGFTTSGFFKIASRLAALAGELCQGKLVCVLEGGYEPTMLAANVEAMLAALAGDEKGPVLAGPSPYAEPDIGKRLARLREIHRL